MRKKYAQLGLWAALACGFWLLETVYFLFAEGWHITATSEAEILCDDIANGLLCACIYMLGRLHFAIIDHYINYHSKG